MELRLINQKEYLKTRIKRRNKRNNYPKSHHKIALNSKITNPVSIVPQPKNKNFDIREERVSI